MGGDGETEIIYIFDPFTDEPQSYDGNFPNYGIVVGDVGTNLFYNSLPFIPWKLNQADSRYDLNLSKGTLAAARRTFLSLSIITDRMEFFMEPFEFPSSESQIKSLFFLYNNAILTFVMIEAAKTVPAA